MSEQMMMCDPHLDLHPDYRGGRPRIKGTRITVDDVARMYLRRGQSLEEIASEYDLPLAALYAAMAYYYDHQEEIERLMAEEQDFAEEWQRQHPSLLREKQQRPFGLCAGEFVVPDDFDASLPE